MIQGQMWQHKDNYHNNVVNQILIKIKMLVVVMHACISTSLEAEVSDFQVQVHMVTHSKTLSKNIFENLCQCETSTMSHTFNSHEYC
jgi:hypothetical protein